MFTELHQIPGGLDIWEYAKKTQKRRNGQKAYLAISHALFRDNIVFFRSEAQKKAIDIITYAGNKRSFDFHNYANLHLAIHNQRAALAFRAEEMGLSVHPWSNFEKVGNLLQVISPGIMEASKNAILADGQGLRKNFADAVRQCKDYMDNTGNVNGSNGNNRNISAINDDRGGRGGGGCYPGGGSHGGRGGGG